MADDGPIDERDLIPISALQHMLYCPRQCALIHIERHWSENRFTAEGRVLHERADAGAAESRRGLRIERSVSLRSLKLGVSGVADVVEMREDGRPYPVEYKRGRPKAHRADEVQLWAQAMCLEEMIGSPVPEGALFYGRTRRRKVVAFDPVLRELTTQLAADTRRMFGMHQTPAPVFEVRKCSACSLKEACQPQSPRRAGTVDRWLNRAIDS